MGLLPDTQNCGLRMLRECRERFPRLLGLATPTGTLAGGFLWSRWRGLRSRHSRRMRNPQFWAFGRRPIVTNRGDCDIWRIACTIINRVLNGNAPFWPTHTTPNSQSHLQTHTSKSHLLPLIFKIYHVLGEIYKILDFPLLGLCQSPFWRASWPLAPKRVVTLRSLITPNHN